MQHGRRGERRLVEEIDRVWEVLDELGVGLAVLDDDRITDASKAIGELFGVDQDWLIGQEAGRALAPGDADFETDRRAALLRRDAPQRRSVNLLHADGTPMTFEIATSTSFYPTILAVRRRDALGPAAPRLLEQLVTLVDSVPNGLAVWDVDRPDEECEEPLLRLAFVNRAGQSILGMNGVDRLGAVLCDVFPAVPDDLRAQIAALAGTEDRAVLPSGMFIDDDDPRTFEVLAVGLPGSRVALRFADLTRLLEQERHRVELMNRVVSVSDDERARLGMAVHDDVIQELVAASLLIETAQLDGADDPALGRAVTALQRGIGALRGLVFELSPPSPRRVGLPLALEQIVDHTFEHVESPPRVSVALDLDVEPPTRVVDATARIATELLRNVARHAGATEVDVSVRSTDAFVELTVGDDGDGFSSAPPADHFGLRMVRDRAESLGGSVDVTSVVGAGTVVLVRLPYRDHLAGRADEDERSATERSVTDRSVSER